MYETEKKVIDIIDKYKDDIVVLMQKLVQIPSYSGNEEEIGEFVLGEMKKFGLENAKIVEETADRPNVVARYHGTEGKPSITVYAHYDTVPSGDISKWSYGPFSGQIVGNRIYGRGVNDHKFPIPTLLFAIKAINEAGLKLKGDVVFAFVGDEERGGHRGMKYITDQGYCDTDCFLYAMGGGSGKTITIAANGSAIYRITVKGKAVHSGARTPSINAAVKAMKLVPRIQELREKINNRKDKIKVGDIEMECKGSLSINLIHAFTEGLVPDLCIVGLSRYFMPQHETLESTQAEIQAIIDDLKKEDPEFDAEVELVPDRWMIPTVSIPDSDLVKALQRSVNKVLGFTPTISTAVGSGSGDYGWYRLKYPDRPLCFYGCSRGSNIHSYDEYSTIDGLIDNTKIYALLLMDYCGVA